MDEKNFDQLWKDGHIFIDTCALDFITRCEFEYAKMIMDVLLLCKDRILVPRQVQSEMMPYFKAGKIQKNVGDIIKDLEFELMEIYSSDLSDKEKRRKVIRRVSKIINRLSKYYFRVYANKLEELKEEYSSTQTVLFPDLEECFSLANQEVSAIEKNKTVNSFINMIMNNVLSELTEQERSMLLTDIERRKQQGLPPGTGDDGKRTNSEGDIVIWNEITKYIKEERKGRYLFITNDQKKGNNWFAKNDIDLHPVLKEEVIDRCGYNALDIATLHSFIEMSKSYVSDDIDVLCEYLTCHNDSVIDEMIEYFQGDDELAEQISGFIRENYMGDWAIPYSYSIEINTIEYDVDLENERVKIEFEFEVCGEIDANYHCNGEDIEFDAEYYANGDAEAYIPILVGKYSHKFSLEFCKTQLYNVHLDEISTTDPLNPEDDIDEEYYDEDYCDYEGDDEWW